MFANRPRETSHDETGPGMTDQVLTAAWGGFRDRWAEYAIEAAGLGSFMISACVFSVLLFHPDSIVTGILPEPGIRRLLMGMAMGVTMAILVYSPFGKRSGAHLNPAVSLAFWQLGRLKAIDAICYIVFQTLGGLIGVLLSATLLGDRLADMNVHFAATVPGPYPIYLVWLAEFIMSAMMFATVLFIGGRKGWESRTGIVAAFLLASFIFFGSPVSGTSLNPSRSVATAALSGDWRGMAIYLTAPIAGMWLVAEFARRVRESLIIPCAKLNHSRRHRCIFCGYRGPSAEKTPPTGAELSSRVV